MSPIAREPSTYQCGASHPQQRHSEGSLSERLRNTIASRAGVSPGRFDSCSYRNPHSFLLSSEVSITGVCAALLGRGAHYFFPPDLSLWPSRMAPKRRAPVPVETVDVDAGEDEHNELCQKCGLGGGDPDRGCFLLASAVAKSPPLPPQCLLFLTSVPYAHDSPPRPASIPASLQMMIALSFAGSFVSNPPPLESCGVGGLQ